MRKMQFVTGTKSLNSLGRSFSE